MILQWLSTFCEIRSEKWWAVVRKVWVRSPLNPSPLR